MCFSIGFRRFESTTHYASLLMKKKTLVLFCSFILLLNPMFYLVTYLGISNKNHKRMSNMSSVAEIINILFSSHFWIVYCSTTFAKIISGLKQIFLCFSLRFQFLFFERSNWIKWNVKLCTLQLFFFCIVFVFNTTDQSSNSKQ